MTKQRQAQILKNQQEKERAKAKALENRDKIDKTNRNKPKRPTAQPEDNSKNIDDTNSPRPQKSKGKRKPRAGGNARVPNDPPLDLDTQDEHILITDQNNPQDDSNYPVGSDELGFYTFFLEGQGNAPDLMGIEDDQLLAIQNDLHERWKARDEARERAISNKLCELEQKHKFANAQYLKHFAHVS